jgi:hypothetical protein
MNEPQVRRDWDVEALGTKPHLILYGSDTSLLERLKPYSSELPYISYEAGYGPQVTAKAHLDAFWVTLMGAAELFDVGPPFPLHQARVVRTPAVRLDKGFPRYGIVGVAVSQNDPSTPEYNLRLVMSALLKAVKDFNSQGQDQILRIGILPDDLELKKLAPKAAFEIVREVYEAEWLV